VNDYPNALKKRLESIILEMSESPELFVKNPGHDFTRKRKLPFEIMLQILLSMGGNSLCKELLDYWECDENSATTEAFIQQRDKILPFAFEFLFHEFTDSCRVTKKYRGYRMLADDGTRLLIATNPNDPDTFSRNKPDDKGFNSIHMNAMYDLLNKLYVDALYQPYNYMNEHKGLRDMTDRSQIKEPVILTCDRGLECYNNFAHIERKGWKYVIRVKDRDSSGILSGLSLPKTDEFDITVNRILTRKYTKEVRAHPEIYRYLSPSAHFDFFDEQNPFYPISFRVLRLKISDDTYETVITNLDQTEFFPQEIKAIYNMRWGIETSFRKLKYAVGLVNFHAKKREFIIQEIFARLIMYNFAEMIISNIIISKTDTKHAYQVNFTHAIHVCRKFIRLWNKAPPPDIEAVIRKNILPIRPDRKGNRNFRSQSVISFVYRVA